MYHGINNHMIFDDSVAVIHGPLSTSNVFNVALRFSCNKGMVLTLVPNHGIKYFSCQWISPYPNERELLFIGGLVYLNIINIKCTQFGYDYYKYKSNKSY